MIYDVPDIILFAECFSIPDEARVSLVEEHLALAALEACGVPFEVRRYLEDELVEDGAAAAHTKRQRLTRRAY